MQAPCTSVFFAMDATTGLGGMPLNTGWVPDKSHGLKDEGKPDRHFPADIHADICLKMQANDDSVRGIPTCAVHVLCSTCLRCGFPWNPLDTANGIRISKSAHPPPQNGSLAYCQKKSQKKKKTAILHRVGMQTCMYTLTCTWYRKTYKELYNKTTKKSCHLRCSGMEHVSGLNLPPNGWRRSNPLGSWFGTENQQY